MITKFFVNYGLSTVNLLFKQRLPTTLSSVTSQIHGRFISSVISNSGSDASITQAQLCQHTKPWINEQSVRTVVRNHYRPNPAKRIKKHGIHKRMTSEGGVAVLWRRFLKGRHNLAVYEDFRPLLKQFQKPPPKVKW